MPESLLPYFVGLFVGLANGVLWFGNNIPAAVAFLAVGLLLFLIDIITG